ncbi:hypothetical protein SAMN05444349_10229 [Bacteroides faecichinchillae]|uniref:Uncharacterized protein n=1 Tax=Bacteroides faecichinchillae TaxID=871325 RepID=A0A1M4T712_9BACE|nr:hypothetical protein SAMN05444349_10229 [Bacteroides faecichinchillae]
MVKVLILFLSAFDFDFCMILNTVVYVKLKIL